MKKWKQKWEIKENWQFVFPVLGVLALLICGYMVSSRVMPKIFEDVLFEYAFIVLVTLMFAILFYYITMYLFKKLRTQWDVSYRWELIAIFLVFAITGSLAAKCSGPILEILGIGKETTNPWIFWPLRLLIIFPIYQVVLVGMGWVFGQYKFFWDFEKKMLLRLGIKLK